MAKSKEIVGGKNIQGQEGLLTAKEARSEIARVLLSKYNEITEIKNDKTLSEDEKNKKIAKIRDFVDVVEGNKDPEIFLDGKTYRELSEEERDRIREIENLAKKHNSSYVKIFQIKEINAQLKHEKDPEKKKKLEQKLKSLKEFYESTKYTTKGNRYNTYLRLREELKSKNEWIDPDTYNEGEWENWLYDGKTIDEMCNLISKNGLIIRAPGDAINYFVERLKDKGDDGYDKFIKAVVTGGIKIGSNSAEYPDRATTPDVLEKLGGLKEGNLYKFGCDYRSSHDLVTNQLETIKKTGGLKEGCEIIIDYYLCHETKKEKSLIAGLIEDANQKGINSTIGIRYDNPHADDEYVGYDSGYGANFETGKEKIMKKNKESVTQRMKNKIKEKPILEMNSDYENIELTDENLKTIINEEGKKLKDMILYSHDIYREKETEERVESCISYFLEKLSEFCKGKSDLTPKMVAGAVLGIGSKILEVYRHPYYLNQRTKDPNFTVDKIDISEKGLIIKTRYTTGTSGTWIGGMKIDDPDYSTQTYLITKEGKCELIDEGSYNMRDLYE